MLYIISGASRSGKSILSRMLLKKYSFSYFSLDVSMPPIKRPTQILILKNPR